MDVSGTFTPVAVELVDNVFGTDLVYHQNGPSAYNPETGVVTPASTDHAVKAGVLSRSRVEAGGTNETYQISFWFHHGAGGLGFLPTTEDAITYDGVVWRVTEVNPTYSATTLIASKVTARGA